MLDKPIVLAGIGFLHEYPARGCIYYRQPPVDIKLHEY